MPAYTFPANREDLAAMRVVVRNGTGREMADLLLDDMAQLLPRLQGQAVPARGPNAGSFDQRPCSSAWVRGRVCRQPPPETR